MATVAAASGCARSAVRSDGRSTKAGANSGWAVAPQRSASRRASSTGSSPRPKRTELPASWTTSMASARRTGIAATTAAKVEPQAIPTTSSGPTIESMSDAASRPRSAVSDDDETTHTDSPKASSIAAAIARSACGASRYSIRTTPSSSDCARRRATRKREMPSAAAISVLDRWRSKKSRATSVISVEGSVAALMAERPGRRRGLAGRLAARATASPRRRRRRNRHRRRPGRWRRRRRRSR